MVCWKIVYYIVKYDNYIQLPQMPLVITHGLLENPPFTLIIVPIEKQKSQCSRISQRPAMFDYPKYHGGVYFITYPRFTRKIVGEIPILDWIMSPSHKILHETTIIHYNPHEGFLSHRGTPSHHPFE